MDRQKVFVIRVEGTQMVARRCVVVIRSDWSSPLAQPRGDDGFFEVLCISVAGELGMWRLLGMIAVDMISHGL